MKRLLGLAVLIALPACASDTQRLLWTNPTIPAPRIAIARATTRGGAILFTPRATYNDYLIVWSEGLVLTAEGLHQVPFATTDSDGENCYGSAPFRSCEVTFPFQISDDPVQYLPYDREVTIAIAAQGADGSLGTLTPPMHIRTHARFAAFADLTGKAVPTAGEPALRFGSGIAAGYLETATGDPVIAVGAMGAAAGDPILCPGEPDADTNGQVDVDVNGRVFLFRKTGNFFDALNRVGAPQVGEAPYFGLGMTVADVDANGVGELLVGESGAGATTQGVEIYRLGVGDVVSTDNAERFTSPYIGWSLASTGDNFVGGPGQEVVAGAPWVDPPGGSMHHGRAHIISWMTGPPSAPDYGASDSFESDVTMQDDQRTGWSAAVGYLDGNNAYAAFGAPGADKRFTNGAADRIGRVHLERLDATGFSGMVIPEIATSASNTRFGLSVAMGDVTGDGVDNLIVGEPDHKPGLVHVFIDDDPTDATVPTDVVVEDPSGVADAAFGYSIAVADMNADGVSDLLVGAPGDDAITGRVYVFWGNEAVPSYGGQNPWSPGYVIQRATPVLGERYGFKVVTAPDFNLDDSPEILIGVPCAANNKGEVEIHYGPPAGSSAMEIGAPLVTDGAPVTLAPGYGVQLGPLQHSFTCTIDWGDGTPPDKGGVPGTCDDLRNGNAQHTYLERGVYTIRINVADDTYEGAVGYRLASQLVTHACYGTDVACRDDP